MSLARSSAPPVTLIGQWRFTVVSDKLSAAMQVAERVYSLAQERDDPTLKIWGYNTLAATLYWSGDLRPLVNSRCMVFKSGAREAASLIRKTSIRRSRLFVL